MKKIISFCFVATILFLVGCNEKYDDTSLTGRLDDLENRVLKLEQLCNQMNTNISSLQTIVNAIQQNDHISSITTINKDNKEEGYTITFTSGKTITIYHGADGKDGQDGKDGYTPKIGVKQNDNGVYCWTIDGEWLKDENGEIIKATPDEGSNGQDGTTPKLKIEDDYWYVSYDNEKSWTQLGKATGKDGMDGTNGMNGIDGDTFFQDITHDDDYVYFTLMDGTTLTVEKKAELALYFDTSSLKEVATNSEVRVDYTVASAAANVEVEVIASADLTAEVVASDNSKKSGYILIRTGSSYDAASKVIVFASDGNKVVMKSITLQVAPDAESAQLYIYNGATKNVSVEGGAVTLSFLTNVECEAVIPDEASSWISASGARALSYKNITLNVAKNTSDRRSAKVKVQSLDGKLSVEYTIVQAGTASSSNPEVDNEGNIQGTPKSNEIFYTSSNGKVVTPENVFGAIIVSNTYENGVGVIVFDRTVTSIGNSAFSFSYNLTNINIPNSVTSIGISAFSQCTSLTNINIPNSVTSIGIYAFSQCTSLTNINIPNSVTSIGINAFSQCTSLTNINIPNSVTSIGSNAFSQCTSLTNINIPNSVTSIDGNAFYACSSLESVVIGTGIKKINAEAFRYCYVLNSITCKAVTPPTGGSNMFDDIGSSPKIYVPTGSGDAYKTKEYWSNYASIIEEKDM